MPMIKKIFSNTIWLLIGNSIGRLAMFLANIFAARLLSQEAYGQFAMIRSTISSLEGLISGTLGSTVIKEVAKEDDNLKISKLLSTVFIINFILSLFLITILVINTELIIAKFFMSSKEMTIGLYIGIMILISSTFSTLTQNILIGFEKFKRLSTLSIITSFISIPIIFILIYFFKLNGALIGVVFYFSLDFLLKFFYYKKLDIKYIFDLIDFKTQVKRISIFVFPLFLAFLVNGFSFWYARVLVVNETKSFEEIAIFDAAFQWLTVIMIITRATTNVTLPKLSKLISNKKEKSKLFYIGLIINIIISVIISIIFIIMSKFIMSIYGESYIKGYDILEVLCYTAIVFTISLYLNRYKISENKSWINLTAASFGCIFMFIYLFYIDNQNTSLSLAWSFFIYYFINIIVYLISFKMKDNSGNIN